VQVDIELRNISIGVPLQNRHRAVLTRPALIPDIFFFGGGRITPTLKKQLTIPPQTAAKLCALNLFFDRNNEAYKHITETLF